MTIELDREEISMLLSAVGMALNVLHPDSQAFHELKLLQDKLNNARDDES